MKLQAGHFFRGVPPSHHGVERWAVQIEHLGLGHRDRELRPVDLVGEREVDAVGDEDGDAAGGDGVEQAARSGGVALQVQAESTSQEIADIGGAAIR